MRSVHLLRPYWMVSLVLLLVTPPSWAGRHHLQKDPAVVAYFGQWGLYNNPPYTLGDLVRNGGAELLDQINYAHASVKGGSCSIADPKADLEMVYTDANSVDGSSDDPASPFRGYFHQLKQLKERYPRLKVLISLEGAPADFREDAMPSSGAPLSHHAWICSCAAISHRESWSLASLTEST